MHAVGRKGPGALHIAAASAHRDDATCLACLPAFFPNEDKPKKVEDHHHIHMMATIMQGDLDRTGTLLHRCTRLIRCGSHEYYDAAATRQPET